MLTPTALCCQGNITERVSQELEELEEPNTLQEKKQSSMLKPSFFAGIMGMLWYFMLARS